MIYALSRPLAATSSGAGPRRLDGWHRGGPAGFSPVGSLWQPGADSWHSLRMDIQETCLDLAALVRDAGSHPGNRVSDMASGLVGSEILRIAAEIRALMAAGRPICNLTVGDFDPR